MKEITELIEPACPEECPNCTRHCASLVLMLADLRRDHEHLLRESRSRPRQNLREELKLVEEHLESAAQAFERVRPRREISPRFPTGWQMQMSARLH